jgi:hypothetical protein
MYPERERKAVWLRNSVGCFCSQGTLIDSSQGGGRDMVAAQTKGKGR